MNRHPSPSKRLAIVLALVLFFALTVAASAGDRNKFPGRRQGGGSQSDLPAEMR